jgi:hypothetical protein
MLILSYLKNETFRKKREKRGNHVQRNKNTEEEEVK